MPAIRALQRLTATLAALFLSAVALPAQERISNTATLDWKEGGQPRSVRSNTVVLDVERAKRPTSLSFRLLPPDFELSGMRCDAAARRFTPAPIDADTLAAAPPLAALDVTAPLIIVLEAPGSNLDPALREADRVQVTTPERQGEVTLIETAPDSGVFAGGFPATGTYPELGACDLMLLRGQSVGISYPENDRNFGSTASHLVDPAGFVFDSATGEPVDGARVTLVDAAGNPAVVFGDDGSSAYPATVESGAAVTDASGRFYPGQPGRYRFPFARPGDYRLKVEPPGDYRAPSAVPRATLATLRAPDGAPFIINDASFGGTLTLVNDPFYADVPLDRGGAASLLLTKTASLRQASLGDVIQYRLQLANRGAAPATALEVEDMLPVGLRYEPGSTRGTAEPSVSADGRALRFVLPSLAAAGSTEIRYLVTVAPGAPVGEALNRAQVRGAGASSNAAAASVRIQAPLNTDAFTIVGRVTEGRCGDPASGRKGVAGVRLLLEDGTYVVTDRDGLYHLEGVRPGRHVVQVDTVSIARTHRPIACDDDTRQAGSAISRFVEGDGGVLKRVDFQLEPTGEAAGAEEALPIAVPDDAAAAGDRDWLAGQQPGIAWLFPAADHNPRAPAIRVAIKHAPGQRVALTVNGERTDPLAYDGSDSAGAVAVSRWSGLPLRPGANRLEARVLGADGQVLATLERVVVQSGAAFRAAFDAGHSRLVADGLARPLVAVRVTDKDGRPVRAGTLVPFRVDQPYTPAVEAALQQARQLAGRERTENSARVVGDDGIAFLALEPTTQAGTARITVQLAEERQVRTTEIKAWLSARPKDWVVVGFGSGTIGWRTLDRHTVTLPPRKRHVAADGQLALYAKGRIRGSWLLTLAYDSDRRFDPDRGLLGTIDPDRYYTVYGDGTRQGYDAASRGRLFLRLERRQFYALFGDFETGLTDTQLTRYSRTLHGAKAAYEGDTVRGTAFAARTDQLYGRDEIQGNGLSGPYRLRARRIVPNSDKLRIEVRDRFRSDRIVSSRSLTRHIDYDIDVEGGTVRFREPILSRDAALNPVIIVADYEVEGGRDRRLVAGGRVAARLGRMEVGTALLRDETQGAATVLGADVKAKLSDSTELRGEFAVGGQGGLDAGRAYLAEVEHHGPRLDLLGYVRRQDGGFGVGQQNFTETDTAKAGLDGRLRLSDRLSLTGSGWFQEQLGGPGRRIAADLRLERRHGAGAAFAGLQLADDIGRDGSDRRSRLLTLGGSQALFGGRLELSGQAQVAPGGADGSVDFPARQQLNAAWRLRDGLRLIGGYEIAQGEAFTAHTARVGFDVAPWGGAKLLGTLNQQAVGENGQRTFAQYGLSQSLPIGRRWTVDATLDATTTVRGRIDEDARINAFQPLGSGDVGGTDTGRGFAAITLGATYRADRWSWNGRVEYRDSAVEQRWGVTSDVLRTLGEGRTVATGLRAFRVRGQSGDAASVEGDVAVAWRPLDSRWSLLERLEGRHQAADGRTTDANVLGVPAFGTGVQDTTRVVNNLALNYRTGPEGSGHGLEATLYHGIKHVRGRYADDRYAGLVQVAGFELRRDLGTRFDVGVQGSVQHAWTAGAVSFSGGPSAGVSPGGNLWISGGYNVTGYRDRDFEADRYTRDGPYLTVRLKFDQFSLGRAGRSLWGGTE